MWGRLRIRLERPGRADPPAAAAAGPVQDLLPLLEPAAARRLRQATHLPPLRPVGKKCASSGAARSGEGNGVVPGVSEAPGCGWPDRLVRDAGYAIVRSTSPTGSACGTKDGAWNAPQVCRRDGRGPRAGRVSALAEGGRRSCDAIVWLRGCVATAAGDRALCSSGVGWPRSAGAVWTVRPNASAPQGEHGLEKPPRDATPGLDSAVSRSVR